MSRMKMWVPDDVWRSAFCAKFVGTRVRIRAGFSDWRYRYRPVAIFILDHSSEEPVCVEESGLRGSSDVVSARSKQRE
jgi:hypothetical protein